MKGAQEKDPYEAFESDQELKRPQPPLVKAPMRDETARISLPRDFENLPLKNDLVSLIKDRRSARVYTGEKMTLRELSFFGRPREYKLFADGHTPPCAPFPAAEHGTNLKPIWLYKMSKGLSPALTTICQWNTHWNFCTQWKIFQKRFQRPFAIKSGQQKRMSFSTGPWSPTEPNGDTASMPTGLR